MSNLYLSALAVMSLVTLVLYAAEILIKTDTGDVKGSLLSEKVFVVQTDTGSIDVPKTVSGGRCEITTDTGDIKISLHE